MKFVSILSTVILSSMFVTTTAALAYAPYDGRRLDVPRLATFSTIKDGISESDTFKKYQHNPEFKKLTDQYITQMKNIIDLEADGKSIFTEDPMAVVRAYGATEGSVPTLKTMIGLATSYEKALGEHYSSGKMAYDHATMAYLMAAGMPSQRADQTIRLFKQRNCANPNYAVLLNFSGGCISLTPEIQKANIEPLNDNEHFN